MAATVSNALINLKMENRWRNTLQREIQKYKEGRKEGEEGTEEGKRKEGSKERGEEGNTIIVRVVALCEHLHWRNNINVKYGFN